MKIDAVSAPDFANAYSTLKSGNDGQFADNLKETVNKANAPKEDAKLKAVCKDFEAMFLNIMYTKMRETVPDNTLYGTSQGEKIIQSMLDTEMTKNMAEAGGVGLAAMMYKQLSLGNKVK